MSYMSLAHAYDFPSKKKSWGQPCDRIFQPFSLTGYFSYAFIYGSWEVIRARKVGTTHTTVDYVVYRLFYPVILLGACLFGVVQEEYLGRFFSLMEIWSMILHISYAFIFLQNCLQNNLHREKVKHRQVIPERLIVTDEIEKGGNKFYICKRSSILPSDRLYNRESFLYCLFNVVITSNVCHLLGHIFRTTIIVYEHNEDLEWMRVTTFGGLALADVFLTPIPMRIAHALYPMMYYGIYLIYSYLLFTKKNMHLYSYLKWDDDNLRISQEIIVRLVGIFIVHCILAGLCSLRDYVISLLDNSQGSKQIQSLRAQKRLARRKIMNYIEGPDGRIIGISLEKHSYVPKMHEVIQTEKHHNLKTRKELESEELSESSSDDDGIGGEGEPKIKKSRTDRFYDEQNVIPVTAKVKPPPQPRYKTRYVRELRLSSSSSDEDFKKIKELKEIGDIQFPTPPNNNQNSAKIKSSKIPIPIRKLGLPVKTRDSRENIQHKLYEVDSPPTPPFVKLVQTMVRLHKATKREVEEYKKQIAKNQSSSVLNDYAHVRSVRVAEDNMTEDDAQKRHDPKRYTQGWQDKKEKRKPENDPTKNLVPSSHQDEALDTTPSAGPQAPRVINVGSGNYAVGARWKGGKQRKIYEYPKKANDFHNELTKKLEDMKKTTESKVDAKKERGSSSVGKERGSSSVGGSESEPKRKPGDNIVEGMTELVNYNIRPRGILRTERRESQVRRREDKLMERREARIKKGKHGQPAYDPLSVPDIEQETTFHYLGTKLKKDFKQEELIQEDLALFQKHPGFSTADNENLEQKTKKPADTAHSLVAFHPIVKYFNVNEKQQTQDNNAEKKLK